MSSAGVVKSWTRAYGFAEATTGEVVWIHKTELPEGMKLKIGETVAFDMEVVEGHGGRVKGVNVSGAAIIPVTEKITKEERVAARSEWEAFKKQKIAVTDEPPKRKAQQAKGPRKAGGAGVQAAPAAADEKRIDPADGQAYTKADFQACYGGLAEWNKAAPRTPPPAPKGRGRGVGSAPYQTTAKRGRGAGAGAAAAAGRGAPFRGPNKGKGAKGAKGAKGGKGGKGGKGRR